MDNFLNPAAMKDACEKVSSKCRGCSCTDHAIPLVLNPHDAGVIAGVKCASCGLARYLARQLVHPQGLNVATHGAEQEAAQACLAPKGTKTAQKLLVSYQIPDALPHSPAVTGPAGEREFNPPKKT